MSDKTLNRTIVHNDHFARFLGYLAIGLAVAPWARIASAVPLAGAVYHFVRWRQDLSKAREMTHD